mmetsp:Transcript_50056/g.60416  ORF Transcript_50056/g.60416 Transcript_50056/m.60416 type:complete len:140 (+) Transcript_50056:141-560(+)
MLLSHNVLYLTSAERQRASDMSEQKQQQLRQKQQQRQQKQRSERSSKQASKRKGDQAKCHQLHSSLEQLHETAQQSSKRAKQQAKQRASSGAFASHDQPHSNQVSERAINEQATAAKATRSDSECAYCNMQLVLTNFPC